MPCFPKIIMDILYPNKKNKRYLLLGNTALVFCESQYVACPKYIILSFVKIINPLFCI